MKSESANYWQIHFEGLVLDPRLPGFEGEFELLDALESESITLLSHEQTETKFKYDRARVRLHIYREWPIYRITLRRLLKGFDILNLRLNPECP